MNNTPKTAISCTLHFPTRIRFVRNVFIEVVLAWAVFGQKAIALDSPCQPTAMLEGENSVVDPVKEILEHRGISTEAASGCPAVRISLKSNTENRIEVNIQDWNGRTSERTLTDSSAVATLIESWARGDISDSVLDHPNDNTNDTANTVDTPIIAGKVPAPLPDTSLRTSAAPRPIRLSTGFETAYGFDKSLFFGARILSCVELKWICLGPLARANYDPAVFRSGDSSVVKRFSADVLLSAEVPIRWKKLSLYPGIGIGIGWLRLFGETYFVTDEPKKREIGDEDEDHVDPQSVVEETGGARLDAHIDAAFSLADAISVAIGASFGWSILAHTEKFIYNDQAAIKGEPLGYIRGYLGLDFDL